MARGRDAAGGRHPAEARALPGQSRAVRCLWQRFPNRRAGSSSRTGAGEPLGRVRPRVCPVGTGTSRFRRPRLTRSLGRSTSWASHRRHPGLATWPSMKAAFRMPYEFLEKGAAADVASKNPDRAAAKLCRARACATLPRTEESRSRRGRTCAGEQQRGENPIPGSQRLCRGRRDRPRHKLWLPGSPPNCKPSLRRMPRSSKARSL